MAGLENRRDGEHPCARRGHRRRHRPRDLDHREPPARGHLASRRGRDVRPDDPGARLQHPQARRQAGQGQGLSREPVAAGGCAARGPGARVFAQGHPVPRLRADEGCRSQEAQEAGRPGRSQRAVSGQAARAHRGSAGPHPGRRGGRGGGRPGADRRRTRRGRDRRLGPEPRPGRAHPRRQPRRRQAAAERGRRGPARRHPKPGGPGRDRPRGSDEPGQVPDDRQAPARERDRRRPYRGLRALRLPLPRRHNEAGADGAGFLVSGGSAAGARRSPAGGATVSGSACRGSSISRGRHGQPRPWPSRRRPSPWRRPPSRWPWRPCRSRPDRPPA